MSVKQTGELDQAAAFPNVPPPQAPPGKRAAHDHWTVHFVGRSWAEDQKGQQPELENMSVLGLSESPRSACVPQPCM